MVDKGLPPFLKAAAAGHIPALEKSFNNDSLTLVDAEGKNALHYAASEGHKDAVEWLLKKGFPIDGTTKKGTCIDKDQNSVSQGLTPFHYAVFKGYSDTARTLATNGSDITLADNQGRTALHLSCVSGTIDIAQWLIATATENKLDPNKPTSEGMTCAHFSALGGHLEILEWLTNTLNVSLKNTTATGMTLIHLASMKGHLEIIQWLIAQPNANDLGLDIKGCDSKKRTPLHLATVGSHDVVVKWLLENGADPRAADSDGKTPLALATGVAANASSSSSSASNPGAAARVKELIANAIAPPSPPSVPTVLTKEQAIEFGLVSSMDETNTSSSSSSSSNATDPIDTTVNDKSESDGTEKLPSGLPLPGYGITPDRVYLVWEAPHQPPAGLPTLDYQVQSAPKWGIGGWKETVLGAVTLPATSSSDEKSGSSTSFTYACVTGLNPSTAYTFRVRARNANGWGSYCNGSKDISTLADNVTASSSSKTAASSTATSATTDETVTVPAPSPPPVPTLSARAVDAVNKNDIPLLTTIAEENEDITGFDTNGRTLLHHASNNGNLEMVKWIINRALVSLNSSSASSPSGTSTILPSSIIDARDRVGASALLLAVVGGHLSVIKYLATKGASIDTADLKGYTALQYAALKLRMPVFRWLCEAGAEPNSKNAKGQTARDILESKLAANANPSLTKEEAAAATYMLTIIGNADNLPTPPPPPVFVDASRYVVAVQLPPAKWVAGAPVPYAYELQYIKKLAMFWTTASDTIPTGINIFTDNYLSNLKIGGGGANATTGDTTTTNSSSNETKDETVPTETTPSVATPIVSTNIVTKQTGIGLYTTVYFAITGLAADTRYVAQVRAKNIRGWGPWSSKSSDFLTKPSSDKYQIPEDLLEAANATQMGCNSIAAEANAAAAQGRRPGPSIFQSPSQLLFASPVILRKSGSATNENDLNSAKRSSNVLFGTQTAPDTATNTTVKDRRDSRASIDSGVSGEYDAIANEAERLGEDLQNRNVLLVAAENGRLDILTETSFVRDIRDAILQNITASSSTSLTSFVDSSVIAKMDATVTTAYLRDDHGFTLTPEQLYTRIVAAVCYSGSVRTLLWLIDHKSTVTAGDDSSIHVPQIPLTVTEARLLLIFSNFLHTESDGKDLYHYSALGGHTAILQLLFLAESVSSGTGKSSPSSAAFKTSIYQHLTRTGANPLHLAAFNGRIDCVQWLLFEHENQLPLTDTTHGWNTLFYSVAGNHGEVCKYIMDTMNENGYDVSACRDKQGRSLAHMAASCDASSILGYMENNSALSSLLYSRDDTGMTPLHYACAADARLAITRLLAFYCKDESNVRTFTQSLKDVLNRSPEDMVLEATNAGTIGSASGTLELLRNWNEQRNVPDIYPAHLTIKREKKNSFAHVSWSTSPASFAYSLSGCTALSADTVLHSLSTYQKYPILPTAILNGTAKATGYEIQWVPLSSSDIPPSLAFGSVSTITTTASLIPTLHRIMFVADNSVEGNSSMTTITHSLDNLPNGVSVYLRIRARRSDGTWSRFSEPVLG